MFAEIFLENFASFKVKVTNVRNLLIYQLRALHDENLFRFECQSELETDNNVFSPGFLMTFRRICSRDEAHLTQRLRAKCSLSGKNLTYNCKMLMGSEAPCMLLYRKTAHLCPLCDIVRSANDACRIKEPVFDTTFLCCFDIYRV